jgi:hypothetical protein
MANGTKAAKLRKYFKKNPEATAKEAAAWVKCSYSNAWVIKREFCKTPSMVRSKNYIPKPQVTTTQSLVIDQAHSTPLVVGKLEKNAQVSDGSTARYYELPDGAKELQDLISHKNMNAQVGEIFRAAYRYGESSHSNELRDAKKIRFYIDAEIKRLGG